MWPGNAEYQSHDLWRWRWIQAFPQLRRRLAKLQDYRAGNGAAQVDPNPYLVKAAVAKKSSVRLSVDTISRPITSDAVAAGDGTLQTCRILF